MVKIRLMRFGNNKRPFYRIVVADSRAPRDGRFLEILGSYAPQSNPVVANLKLERISYWLNRGAKPTETVASLLKKEGFWQKIDKNKAA
ncbi:MAG: 30S ribosomal protein S16 [Desulfobacterota bacterium]|nr:30S ribosomal protein S16 [Thermodesulfobacteriota bacterium]